MSLDCFSVVCTITILFGMCCIKPLRLLSVSLVTLLNSFAARAQDVFQPGYIITLQADTVQGQVRQLGSQRGQRECVFRPGASAGSTTYAPAQLQGYGLNAGTQFRRGRVALHTSDAAPDTATALRFQEVLVAGRATLLFAADDDASPHFFLRMAGGTAPPMELRVIKRKVVEPPGRVTLQTINQFQQILLSSFADCPSLKDDIKRARLLESELPALVQRYNACVAPAGTAVQPVLTPKTTLRLSLLAGAARAQMVANSVINAPRYNRTLVSPISPAAGFEISALFPRFSKGLSINLGGMLMRTSYKGTAPGRELNSFTIEDRTEIFYALDFLTVPLTLRYEVGQKFLRPFIEGGISWEARLKEQQNEYTIYYQDNSRAPEKRTWLRTSGSAPYGLIVGAGLNFSREGSHTIGLRARYERLRNIANDPFATGAGSRFTVLLGYSLRKNR